MATITVTPGHTYGTTDTVTSTNLNDLGSPTAALTAGSILTADIADSNVTTAKIADANVTKAKIENLSDYTVLGNVSGGAAAPAEVSILDEDDMASDSDTAIATQQSIKAYVTAMRPKFVNITGATLALSNTKSTTGSQTYTYNIADFTSDDVDFSTNKIVGLVISAYATSGQSSNIVKVDLPTGIQTPILRASADGTSDFDQSQTTTTIPINSGQTSIDITLEVNNAQSIAASFGLYGFIILPGL